MNACEYNHVCVCVSASILMHCCCFFQIFFLCTGLSVYDYKCLRMNIETSTGKKKTCFSTSAVPFLTEFLLMSCNCPRKNYLFSALPPNSTGEMGLICTPLKRTKKIVKIRREDGGPVLRQSTLCHLLCVSCLCC